MNVKSYNISIFDYIDNEIFTENRVSLKYQSGNLIGKNNVVYKNWKNILVINNIFVINTLSIDVNYLDNTIINMIINDESNILPKNVIEKKLKINKVDRGYESFYFLNDRIEKHQFNENLGIGKLSIKELKSLNNYKEIHCANYYENMESIFYLKNLILERL